MLHLPVSVGRVAWIALVALCLAPVSAAHAELIFEIEDFTFDNNDGVTIEDVDEVDFDAINHVVVSKAPGNVNTTQIEPGDTARVQGIFAATSFVDRQGAVMNPPLFNASPQSGAWELTGKFATNIEFTSVTTVPFGTGFALATEYQHVPMGDSFLNLYVDIYGTNAAQRADFGTGLGFDNPEGTLFASFEDTFTGLQNPFTANFSSTGDPEESGGQDKGRFELVSGLAGYLFGPDGEDLIATGILKSIFVTEQVVFDPSDSSPTAWSTPFGPFPGSDTSTNFPVNFFARGDGDVRLEAVVPEPSSLLLAALGVAALVGHLVRRRRADAKRLAA